MGDAAADVAARSVVWNISADKTAQGERRSGGRHRGRGYGTITEDAASMDIGAWTAVGGAADGRPCGMLLRTRPPGEGGGAGPAAKYKTIRLSRRILPPWT